MNLLKITVIGGSLMVNLMMLNFFFHDYLPTLLWFYGRGLFTLLDLTFSIMSACLMTLLLSATIFIGMKSEWD